MLYLAYGTLCSYLKLPEGGEASFYRHRTLRASVVPQVGPTTVFLYTCSFSFYLVHFILYDFKNVEPGFAFISGIFSYLKIDVILVHSPAVISA